MSSDNALLSSSVSQDFNKHDGQADPARTKDAPGSFSQSVLIVAFLEVSRAIGRSCPQFQLCNVFVVPFLSPVSCERTACSMDCVQLLPHLAKIRMSEKILVNVTFREEVSDLFSVHVETSKNRFPSKPRDGGLSIIKTFVFLPASPRTSLSSKKVPLQCRAKIHWCEFVSGRSSRMRNHDDSLDWCVDRLAFPSRTNAKRIVANLFSGCVFTVWCWGFLRLTICSPGTEKVAKGVSLLNTLATYSNGYFLCSVMKALRALLGRGGEGVQAKTM